MRFAGAGASLLMVASRNRPEGGLGTPFGLGVLMLLLLSSEVGQQDLAALIARQPVVDRSQKAAFASPFGTIHEAKFSVADATGDPRIQAYVDLWSGAYHLLNHSSRRRSDPN